MNKMNVIVIFDKNLEQTLMSKITWSILWSTK